MVDEDDATCDRDYSTQTISTKTLDRARELISKNDHQFQEHNVEKRNSLVEVTQNVPSKIKKVTLNHLNEQKEYSRLIDTDSKLVIKNDFDKFVDKIDTSQSPYHFALSVAKFLFSDSELKKGYIEHTLVEGKHKLDQVRVDQLKRNFNLQVLND